MRSIITILIFCFAISGFSQELNCNVIVNAQLTGNENLPVFKTLEKQLTEFVNNTKWTDKTFSLKERIDCSMFINITDYNANSFKGTLQVKSSRPVFGSSYSTPLYNFNDKDFSFRYLEFQNLIFNPNQFESNLVSILAFHIYVMLGLDADSFSVKDGEDYFKQAQTIASYSQQENFKGWKIADGLQNRFVLIDNILSNTYKEFRDVMYKYHRTGLDVMSDKPKEGKEKVAAALMQFKTLNSRRPNSFILRTFFDAKSDEIENAFSSGPNVKISELKDLLQKIAPNFSGKWQNIKF